MKQSSDYEKFSHVQFIQGGMDISDNREHGMNRNPLGCQLCCCMTNFFMGLCEFALELV